MFEDSLIESKKQAPVQGQAADPPDRAWTPRRRAPRRGGGTALGRRRASRADHPGELLRSPAATATTAAAAAAEGCTGTGTGRLPSTRLSSSPRRFLRRSPRDPRVGVASRVVSRVASRVVRWAVSLVASRVAYPASRPRSSSTKHRSVSVGRCPPPELIKRINPEYPEVARKARIQGVVILEAIIDKEGNVTNVRVLRGLPMGLSRRRRTRCMRWQVQAGFDERPPRERLLHPDRDLHPTVRSSRKAPSKGEIVMDFGPVGCGSRWA